MSEKRRDNKNRILRTGESQRKDGRYAYKCINNLGKIQFVYAWKLVPTDRTPNGKKDDISLREKIAQIEKDLKDNINPIGGQMTVEELYEKHIKYKSNVRLGTNTVRRHLMKTLEQDKLGRLSIDKVKVSDAKDWVLRMKEKGYAYGTIKNYRRFLLACFYTAVREDYVRKNPFSFDFGTVIEDTTIKKQALTKEQEESLLLFIREDMVYKKYYDDIVVLLGTELRISKLCGLTLNDVDFENRLINVDHQLLYCGKKYIAPPKTKNGIRQIPMSEEVYQAMLRIKSIRKDVSEVVIDGYKDFMFVSRTGQPRTQQEYCSTFSRLIGRYNMTNITPMPKIMTLHTLRHTFCTKLANAGLNPKSLQYLMGHASIAMTLDYYTHANIQTVKEEFNKLAM